MLKISVSIHIKDFNMRFKKELPIIQEVLECKLYEFNKIVENKTIRSYDVSLFTDLMRNISFNIDERLHFNERSAFSILKEVISEYYFSRNIRWRHFCYVYSLICTPCSLEDIISDYENILPIGIKYSEQIFLDL